MVQGKEINMDRRLFFATVTAVLLSLGLTGISLAQTHTATQAAKASSAYLRLDGIPGDSPVVGHRGEIEIETYSWAESQPAAGASGGRASGRVNMGTFHLTAVLSPASPRLLQACANGQIIRSAVLSVSVPNYEFLYWRLWDVTIRDYRSILDTRKDPRPRDEFSLEFARIEIEYKPVTATGAQIGPVRSGWDVRANRPF
jgi:type VI secretion system secreted protein Hcp